MMYVLILQWTPFPGRWESISEWQLQEAERDLRLGKRYYYENAIKTNAGYLYPEKIARRIIEYWGKRYPFAKYKVSAG